MAGALKTKVAQQKMKLRETLWPGVEEDNLWHRKRSDGWVTTPRTMPLLLRIMDMLAPKGKPVSATYLDLWCRTYDDSFVIVSKVREMAYFAGFTGERAHHTWTARIRELEKMGFIRTASGAGGPVNYVLLLNPYDVVRQLDATGKLRAEAMNALRARMVEIGATDLDD